MGEVNCVGMVDEDSFVGVWDVRRRPRAGSNPVSNARGLAASKSLRRY